MDPLWVGSSERVIHCVEPTFSTLAASRKSSLSTIATLITSDVFATRESFEALGRIRSSMMASMMGNMLIRYNDYGNCDDGDDDGDNDKDGDGR